MGSLKADYQGPKIRCLVIDDEPAAHQVLVELMNNIPWLEFCGSCYDAIEALDKIPKVRPDILFLDVKMPEITGFQLLDLIHDHHLHIIIVSAHSQYAMAGFDYDVAAYLLKPISFERLIKAILKIRKLMDTSLWKKSLVSSATIHTAGNTPLQSSLSGTIWIKSGIKIHSLKYKNIYYIEGLKDYVKVHSRDGVLVSYGSIASISLRLPTDTFVRIHRSYIINVEAIAHIEGNVVTMINKSQLPLAANKDRDEIFNKIIGNIPAADDTAV